jgi:hypothetical protein
MAQSVDLGDGFVDHGVATPISNHRGTVATWMVTASRSCSRG